MIGKMQNKMQAKAALTCARSDMAQTTATMMLAALAFAVMVFITPASANQASQVPLAVYVETFPENFYNQAYAHKLDVVAVDRLEALNAYIVTLRSADGLAPAQAFNVLNNTFPGATFSMMNESEARYDLVWN